MPRPPFQPDYFPTIYQVRAKQFPVAGVEPSSYPFQVIGAGFGRTGTYSMKTALEQLLNAPCYHDLEANEHRHSVVWEKAFKSGVIDTEFVFERMGYKATLDWPACVLYAHLATKYPNAKVVLTVRDSPDKWYDSVKRLLDLRETWWVQILLGINVCFGCLVGPRTIIRVWNRMDAGKKSDLRHYRDEWAREPEIAKRAYLEHIEEVKALIPADRLLVFNVKEGWEPLCKFLGVPVPEGQSFPHLNEGLTELVGWHWEQLTRDWPWWVVHVGIYTAVGYALARSGFFG